MKNLILVALATLTLTSCGALGGFSRAVQESGELQARSDELEQKMDLLDETIAAYGPIAESFGPEVQAAYADLVTQTDVVRGYVEEGKDLLGDAVTLHEQSIAKATDPETGETDWAQYGMLMLLGGGGLASERMKTGKEKKQVDKRIDDRKHDIAGLEAQLVEVRHRMDLEQAKREASAT